MDSSEVNNTTVDHLNIIIGLISILSFVLASLQFPNFDKEGKKTIFFTQLSFILLILLLCGFYLKEHWRDKLLVACIVIVIIDICFVIVYSALNGF